MEEVASEASGLGAPEMKLAVVCGLFCPARIVFIGSTEEPGRRGAQRIAPWSLRQSARYIEGAEFEIGP